MTIKYTLDSKSINPIVEVTLDKLITMAKQSHIADVVLRFNGKDHRVEADWIKYLEKVDES